ncbi:NAD(P)-binding protein [Xylona heveae TC161]|uniref:Probable quinone oxidoreductase n=1 Tax=Xylona heveae (strain CBS 132557 / TC161) TaxID=1328760 RepID=A0A165H9P9_XYLHT|nr:NAD(P)-binding protein [Xylona heveae TC161]KZF23182.1 NAD(P)-binding protein [Xylona heveae TC161]
MASSTIPKTMTGILVEKTGGPEVLQYKTDLAVPTPKEGEILVKNEYTGINFIDTYFRTGLYPSPKPEILGREASGIVVDVGPGESYSIKKGDRVVYLGTSSYAEYTATPAAKASIVPEQISSQVAAAALLQGLTALTLVRESYAVKKGDWILVHAAAGGVGGWLCQLLRAIGARVIGTASTQAKRDLAKSLGAEFLIDYTTEDLVARVKEITGGQGVAAVFDGVGKSTFDADLELLARKGSLVSFGNASGAVPPFAIARLSAKNITLLRPTLFNYIATREEFDHYVQELFGFIIKDKLSVGIHETYPLKDVARAQIDLEARKTTGKLLLQP